MQQDNVFSAAKGLKVSTVWHHSLLVSCWRLERFCGLDFNLSS